MILWHGASRPPLDPYKRELHDVPMHYTVEQATDDAMHWILLICGPMVAFCAGFLMGGNAK